MKKILFSATIITFLGSNIILAQAGGLIDPIDPNRDEIGIVRDGNVEGYSTFASLLQWIQNNIVFPTDGDTDPTNELYDDTAVVATGAANTAAIAAHVAADGDTDATNELGVVDAAAGTYDPDGSGPAPAQTLPVPTGSTYTANADGSIALSGANSLTIPLDTTSSTAAANALTRGLSAGQVNKPTGSAASVFDVSGASPDLEVSYPSMLQLFTNRAVEANGGMMNRSGSLGNFMEYLGRPINGGTFTPLDNGGLIIANRASGDSFTLGAPQYDGQNLTIWGGTNIVPQHYMIINAATLIIGSTRRVSNGSVDVQSPNNVAVIRQGETIKLRGAGANWVVINHDENLLKGTGWRENHDGTISAFGNLPINTGSFPPFNQFPPFCADNGATYICTGGQL